MGYAGVQLRVVAGKRALPSLSGLSQVKPQNDGMLGCAGPGSGTGCMMLLFPQLPFVPAALSVIVMVGNSGRRRAAGSWDSRGSW